MKILGIDPGLQKTGYALIEARENIKLLESGVLVSEKQSWKEAIVEITDQIEDLIDYFSPDEIAIEGIYTFLNPLSALKLAHLKGAIFYVLAKKKLSFHEYPPSVVKKSITGRGNASKNLVKNYVEKIVGCKLSGSDSADALSIAITHYIMRGRDDRLY